MKTYTIKITGEGTEKEIKNALQNLVTDLGLHDIKTFEEVETPTLMIEIKEC